MSRQERTFMMKYQCHPNDAKPIQDIAVNSLQLKKQQNRSMLVVLLIFLCELVKAKREGW